MSMSVSSILMAVLTTVSTPLGPTHAVVGLDTVQPPIDALVKVRLHDEHINSPSLFQTPLCSIFFQISMSVSSTLIAVLTIALTPLGPTHVAVIQDTVLLPTDMHVKVHFIKSQYSILIPMMQISQLCMQLALKSYRRAWG